MKRIIFILLLICISFTYNNQANAKNFVDTYNREQIEFCTNSGLSKSNCKSTLNFYYHQKSVISKIEKDTQICLDKGIAMHSCNYNAISKYKTEIQNIIKNYKKILPEEKYDKLLLSQKSWEEYYKNNTEIQNEIMNFKNSTISYTIFSGQLVDCIKNRIVELLDVYYSYITLE